jgi:hypothetical protein
VTALPGAERQVLILRANLAGSRPRPRNRVAAMLGASEQRVAMLERGGLRRLRRSQQDTGCSAGAGQTQGGSLARGILAPGRVLGVGSTADVPGSSRAGSRSARTLVVAAGDAVRRMATHASQALASYAVGGPSVGPVHYRWLLLSTAALSLFLLITYLGYQLLDAGGWLQGWHYRRSLRRASARSRPRH